MSKRVSNGKPASGGARLMSKYKPVLLGLTPEEHAEAVQAADRDGRPLTRIFKDAGMAVIRRLLAKKYP